MRIAVDDSGDRVCLYLDNLEPGVIIPKGGSIVINVTAGTGGANVKAERP